jgi:hypothetical protein
MNGVQFVLFLTALFILGIFCGMNLKHLSGTQIVTYAAIGAAILAAIFVLNHKGNR